MMHAARVFALVLGVMATSLVLAEEQREELSKYQIILLNDVEAWQKNADQGREEWNAATTYFITQCLQRNLVAGFLSSYEDDKSELRKLDSTRVLIATSTWTYIKTKKLLRNAVAVTATVFFKNAYNEVVFTASATETKRDWKQALQLSFMACYEQFLEAHPGFDKSTNYLERKKARGPGQSRSAFIKEFDGRMQSLVPLEGLWATVGDTGEYDDMEVAIVRQFGSEQADYVAYLTKTSEPRQLVGHLRMLITNTAVEDVFKGSLIDNRSANLESFDMVLLSLNHIGVAVKSSGRDEQTELHLVRVYPKYPDIDDDNSVPSAASIATTETSEATLAGSGTGFLIDTSAGLVATNFHVIENAKRLRVVFPLIGEEYDCSVVTADRLNDLVILRMANFDSSVLHERSLPYRLESTSSVTEGEKVFTIGFPLGALLGAQPKYSDGSVSGLFGVGDDPRVLQISVPIQPGNSGGPLITEDGRLVGVVVAALDAKFLLENAGIVPQNVNFAIKSAYLELLMKAVGVEWGSAVDQDAVRKDVIQASKIFTATIQNWR